MNRIFPKALLLITTVSGALVFCIFALLAYLCFDLFDLNQIKEFFTITWSISENKYGIVVSLFGTFIVSLFSLVLSFIFSFSICAYIFLSTNTMAKIILEKSMLLMAAVPTVIYAFAALFTFVPFISSYIDASSTLSILVASVTLSLVLIPTMGLIFLNIFKTQAKKYEKTCTNLGLDKEQFFFKFVIKNSISSLTTGVILAMTRALGDTMIVLMLAGNALSLPGSVFDSARSLTSHIALIFANDYESMAFKAIFLCAFLLLSSNFMLILIIKYIKGKKLAN